MAAGLRMMPFAVLLLPTIILLSCSGMTSARSTGLQSNTLSQLLTKRNSWWSKKSVSPPSDYTRFDPEDSQEDQIDSIPDGNTELLLCYMLECVPDFTACATHSRSAAGFQRCRKQHQECGNRCLVLTKQQQGEEDDRATMK